MPDEVTDPQNIGHFQKLRKIGESPLHEIFEARSTQDQAQVALKLCRLNSDYSLARMRFDREMLVSNQLRNNHAIRVLETGSLEHARPYLAMELLVGRTVAAWVDENSSIAEQDTISVLVEACEYLVELHQLGFVHCDLKPQNLFVLSEPLHGSRIKVLDLGICRSLNEQQELLPNHISGSPHYMSPEAIRSPERIDGRSDIYSLGCTAYQMLTGTTPFAGNNPLQICSMHLKQQPRPFDESTCSVSQPLQSLIFQCLSKNPNDRPQNALAFLEVLQDCRLG